MRIFRSPFLWYKIARRLARWHVPLLPSLLDYFIRFVFGCWLPHTTKIGDKLELGYGGLGTVVHGECTLGDNVHLGTGVTLGGNVNTLGAPVLGDNVYVGTGAKIMGPVTIGSGSIVGANAVVTKDIPERCIAMGVPARITQEDIDIADWWDKADKPT